MLLDTSQALQLGFGLSHHQPCHTLASRLLQKVDAAAWLDCGAGAAADSLGSAYPTITATGHNTFRVRPGRRTTTPATPTAGTSSPHGRSSTCSSPKTPEQLAAAQLRSLQKTPLPLILARMKVGCCWPLVCCSVKEAAVGQALTLGIHISGTPHQPSLLIKH